jgi:hypothetical protein
VNVTNRDSFVAAVTAELKPFEWRSLTAEMLARRVVAAVDRRCVHELLQSKLGPTQETWECGDATGRSDERVEVLIEFMSEHRWRTWALPFLARQLLGTLDAWWARRQRLEVELNQLVGGDG